MKDKPFLFPDNIQFWFETVRAFGAAGYGGSEFGEVLATTARIRSGNFDSWYDEWDSSAEKAAREGAEQLARGHRISARDSFLRASTITVPPSFFCMAIRAIRGLQTHIGNRPSAIRHVPGSSSLLSNQWRYPTNIRLCQDISIGSMIPTAKGLFS